MKKKPQCDSEGNAERNSINFSGFVSKHCPLLGTENQCFWAWIEKHNHVGVDYSKFILMHQNNIFVKNALQVLKVDRSESSTLQTSNDMTSHPKLTFLHLHVALIRCVPHNVHLPHYCFRSHTRDLCRGGGVNYWLTLVRHDATHGAPSTAPFTHKVLETCSLRCHCQVT